MRMCFSARIYLLLVVGCLLDFSVRAAIRMFNYQFRGQAKRHLRRRETPIFGIKGVGDPVTSGCSEIDNRVFENGAICGTPLSLPCFDYGRCSLDPDEPGPKIYVYDDECSLKDSGDMDIVSEVKDWHNISPIFRNAARELGVLAETYESACMFIDVNTKAKQAPCATSSPLWNEGANHLMIDLTDGSR